MSVIETVVAASAAIATLLAIALLVWTLALRRRKEIYIAPFHVAGGQPDPQLGIALSNMLRARLERLQRELGSVQDVLEAQRSASPPDAGLGGIVLPSSIEVPRAVFEPLQVQVSIGKVSVGGLVPWLQGWALNDRTIQLTVVFEDDRAIVSGDLKPLGAAKVQDVWVECGSGVEELITRTAHALLQSRVADEAAGPIGALDLHEFEDLLSCLYQLAELNRRALSGGSRAATVASSVRTLERLGPLTERFPDWNALVRLGLTVAERAGELEHARAYRVQLGLASAPTATESHDAGEPVTEERFIALVRQFFKRLYPDDEPPAAVFEAEAFGFGVQAWWNTEQHRYEVNTEAAAAPDLPGYVALMGRFMLLHYDECVGDPGESTVDGTFWNDFRLSVVEYLLQTDPTEQAVETGMTGPLFDALMSLERGSGVTRANVRSLALALIDRFACNWTADSLVEYASKVNEELEQPIPDQALRETLAQARKAPAGA